MLTEHQKKWFCKERKRRYNAKKLKKSYLHFDNKISFQNFEKSATKIFDETRIKKHTFFPFIKHDLITKRYKKVKDEKGNFVKNQKGKFKRKMDPKVRPICYASHFDSLIYSWYGFLLSEEYNKILETENLSNCILAYRRIEKIVDGTKEGKCNIDFAKEVFDKIRERKNCIAIAFDIESFFENLNHQKLKEDWKNIMGFKQELLDDHYQIFKSLTKYRFIKRDDSLKLFGINLNKDKVSRICSIKQLEQSIKNKQLKVYKHEKEKDKNGESYYNKGIPQGSPISAILANIYLLEFDKEINAFLKNIGGYYRRYSDDILIICEPIFKTKVIKKIEQKIETYNLRINKEKTEYILFYEENNQLKVDRDSSNKPSLQYLGFEFDGRNIFIRTSSMARFYRKMKYAVKVASIKARKNKKGDKTIWKNKLYKKFTHLGKRNFVSYAQKAFDGIMKVESIKKQISKYWKILHEEIEKRSKEI